MQFYNQALPIIRGVGDPVGEATTLNNLGGVYSRIGQPQEALQFYNQALPILQAVGDQAGEARALNNIGQVYVSIGQPAAAITNLQQSVVLTLQTRRGLTKDNRQQFLQPVRVPAVALINLLIEQRQPEQAYEWANRATTFDLADYTRLLNAKVVNPQAQQAIDRWNQQNQQLQLLRQRLQESFSEPLARQMRALEAQVNQQAENIARRFPEAAELFEIKPTDLAQFRASIPVGTTVIHPVLLTNVSNVPDAVAIFVLTPETLTVTKVLLNGAKFDALLTQTYAQLSNRLDNQYVDNLATLYDLLLRPVAAQIQATKPKQLSFIATGKLRYLPFETLFDRKTEQYLLQKYPVSYLTRLSTRPLQDPSASPAAPRVLAFGNPVPKGKQALAGTEGEVKRITQLLPGSQALIHSQATLDAFKTQAPRFSLLHLATHGCFLSAGCPKLGLAANTILFADQSLHLADAALLGLQNVDLITLSACQTALETNSNGEEIAGLAYLFERAGAKAVIASLWNADDKETQALMVQFYQNLKQGRSQGITKSEALRQAKLSQIAKYPDGLHPYFWSPFILIGDAR